MTVAASAWHPTFMDGLAASRAGRLLRQELGRRWPDTADQLAAIIRYALLPAGKLIRPMMTLYAAEAVGGDPQHVLPAALGMEYLHVATLVHDDIIDADETRRGRPAVPAAYGIPHAIVAGDHLVFSAFESIVECRATLDAERVVAATGALAAAGTDLCRGQVLESQLAGDPETGLASYLEMIRLKTGALFRAVCQVGAVLGGADASLARRLAGYGEHLGMAFQMRDDLLAYLEPARVTGKPATSDLTNGRPTLPVLLAYESGTPAQRRQLTAALNHGRTGEADLARVHALLAETTALARAKQRAVAQTDRARAHLSGLPSSPSVEVLTGIARWAGGQEPGG
jgi:geranylgeranyl diphosphate synthase, type I